MLGLSEAAGGDEVFRQLVLARIIEPSSKPGSLRVLEEAGAGGPSYATLKRRLPAGADAIPEVRVVVIPDCLIDVSSGARTHRYRFAGGLPAWMLLAG